MCCSDLVVQLAVPSVSTRGSDSEDRKCFWVHGVDLCNFVQTFVTEAGLIVMEAGLCAAAVTEAGLCAAVSDGGGLDFGSWAVCIKIDEVAPPTTCLTYMSKCCVERIL